GKAVNGIVPMDKSIVLDDVTVHFTGYEFDSEVVTFYYDIIGTTRMDIRPMGINGAVFNGTAGTEDKENNMVKNCHATVALYEPVEIARILFGKDLTDLTDKSYTSENAAFAVTVHFDPESVIKATERRKIMVGDYEQATRTVVYDDAYITPTHITVRLNNFYRRSLDDIRAIGANVVMQDGSVITTHTRSVITADDGSDIIWLVREFDEPIDISQIKDAALVTNDSREGEISWYFYGEIYEKNKNRAERTQAEISIENAALYTPADVWFEYSNTRAHIIGYTFDGMNGRICYEVYHDNPSDRLNTNHGCVCNPNVMTCDEAFCGGGTMYTDYEPEGIVVHDYSIYAYEFCDELTLPFYSKWGSDEDKEMSKDYTFTMKRNTDIPCKTGVIDKYAQCEWGDTIHFDTYVLTPRTLSVMTADSPYNDDYRSETGDAYMKKIGEMRPVITLKNGSVISFDVDDDIYLKPISGGGKSGRFWNYYQFRDYIDIDEIALITMDGIEIYNSEKNP
ncbi:MAG: hypothetical protein IK990_17210, partial [Ruminiclostridium sp.]|nr:hypothetical protein [Ruminiclostridium sp.]